MDINNLKHILTKYPDIIANGLLIRKVEECLLKLCTEGKIKGTVHTCIGQELIGPSLKRVLTADDVFVSNHRGHGHYLAMTGNIKGLIAEVMGKKSGICGGVGGSQHIFDKNFISNGIQGGMTPVAAGIALANQYLKNGNIVVIFLGDGTLGEGVLYEVLNISSLWKLPILFVLENNKYAQSSCMDQTFSGDIKKRAEGFGLNYMKSNTWDLELLTASASDAVELVRNANTPVFIEIDTYRLHAHSKGDDNRSEVEILEYASRDILTQFIFSEMPEVKSILDQVAIAVHEAMQFASDSPNSDFNKPIETQSSEIIYEKYITAAKDIRINDLIYESFKVKFANDTNYIMIGEDIEYTTPWTPNQYGGAFKVTKDLSEIFKGRIRNTPISEAAIVGIGTGMALAGLKPIIEIMFGDFITLAFDQLINHATKFCGMFGREIDIPLIIRTPMGGRRGYGPTHSQSLEKFFLGIPNLSVVVLNQRIDPNELYACIYKNTNPTLVIENKVMYARHLNTSPMHGFIMEKTNDQFPVLRIRPHNDWVADVTVVCYGGMLEEVEKAVELAFDKEEIACEIICPTLINPLNHSPIVESVRKSGKLLVVEEGCVVASLGSEIASTLLKESILVTKFKHVGNNAIIPCSAVAESRLLPNHELILSVLRDMIHGR